MFKFNEICRRAPAFRTLIFSTWLVVLPPESAGNDPAKMDDSDEVLMLEDTVRVLSKQIEDGLSMSSAKLYVCYTHRCACKNPTNTYLLRFIL